MPAAPAPLRAALAPALLLVALGVGAAPAGGDLLVPRSGPKVRGRLVRQDASGVVFNPWWSSHPGMTWEVLRLPADQVKRVDVEPWPEPEFHRRLAALAPDDAPALTALAVWAREKKLKPEAEMAAALAAVAAPADAAALAAAGGAARLASLKRGRPTLDRALRAELRAYAGEADPAARAARAQALKAAGQPYRPEELERLRRSALLPRGRHDEVPLSLHADRHPDATYSLFVPEAYEPSVPWPLLVGLHGGGPDGKDRDEVVGSGRSALDFYVGLAARHGVLVACPDALEAGWGSPANEALVRDLIQELRLLYAVDVDRIHLTGHSMGGFGTWALGPRMADLFATIAPAAGAGSGGVSELLETRTPIFIYHSADDFIDVAPDRAAARALREADADFVYTELEKEGHGYPEAVRAETFEFLLPRRNADPARKDAWPRSSLLGKVGPEERLYLGDPAALDEAPSLEALVSALRLGGGRARWAAARVLELRPPGAADALARLLREDKPAPHARAEVARALGPLGDPAAAPALRRAVALPAGRLQAPLTIASAQALAALPDPEAGEALGEALTLWSAWFEGKRTGSRMCFSDWERGLGVLAALSQAWAVVGGKDPAATLERAVVARVFAQGPEVETSDRVPQDPSVARTALATAVARAYRAVAAPADRWEALLAALARDPRARAAAEALRR